MSAEQLGDMRTEYSKALVAVGEEDPNIVVLGADTTDSLKTCLLYTSPSPRDRTRSRMPSSA